MKQFNRIMLILYIGGNMVYVSTFVGKFPTNSEPYDWTSPFLFGIWLGCAAILGYWVGRD